MTQGNFFRFEKGVASFSEINSAVICTGAKFVCDYETVLLPDDLVELKDGQFFLIRNNLAYQVDGKWSL